MKALFATGGEVPFARVVADHRRVLEPLGALLAINLGVLVLVVLPLRASVASGGTRAQASSLALADARAELAAAEAARDGQAQASRDLERFYREVLPADLSAAQRITHSKLSLLARSHDVVFRQSSTSPTSLRESSLDSLVVNYSLTGRWEDVQQFIHAVETLPDFVVIDNLSLAQDGDGNTLSLALAVSTYYQSRRDGR
ncbi:MAG: type 4a pilus biogenesis protein PilO [Acidobacteriota bacterium]|nr:type 4a pilus biogenesis protein PilO [Acidobacteriota bacterium]